MEEDAGNIISPEDREALKQWLKVRIKKALKPRIEEVLTRADRLNDLREKYQKGDFQNG